MTRLFSGQTARGTSNNLQKTRCDVNFFLHIWVYKWQKMADLCSHHVLTVTHQGITHLPEQASPRSVLFIFTTEGCFHTCHNAPLSLSLSLHLNLSRSLLLSFSRSLCLQLLSIVGSSREFHMCFNCLSLTFPGSQCI